MAFSRRRRFGSRRRTRSRVRSRRRGGRRLKTPRVQRIGYRF